MIEVNNICKFYGEKKAVENLSFSISQGEIVGLLGLNGAGKSTILKVLGCFLLPSKGEARVGSHSVTLESHRVRQLIGYLPDRPPLYMEMDVASYLNFVARLKDTPRDCISTYVNDALEQTGLTHVRHWRLAKLSHGYQQRVGIAQAIVHKPKVLILDEPINGLDPIQIAEMRDLILSLKGRHTVILSSHILSEITRTCDRILVIDKGSLVAEGTEQELMASMDGALHISVELASWDEAMAKNLRSMNGVRSIEVEASQGTTTVSISCASDIRSQIASKIVSEGGQLLTLRKRDAELENLFFKLIKSGVER